jgi:hypothetical protein
MSAKDRIHRAVKNAPINDGWTITHDPLTLRLGKTRFEVDLAAEQFFAAKKDDRFIAVEVKSFIGDSAIVDLERALGQFVPYHDVLELHEPYRVLHLGVSEGIYESLFATDVANLLLDRGRLRLIVVDLDNERIVRWIP